MAARTIRDKTIITLFRYTGLRAGELVSLLPADFDRANRTVKVFGKGSKERVVPFNGECTQILNQYFAVPEIPYLTQDGVYYMVKAACRKSGVQFRGLHCFRHTFATDYLERGGNPLDLMRILGHSSLKMTDHYSQWVASQRAISNYHRLFDTPPKEG